MQNVTVLEKSRTVSRETSYKSLEVIRVRGARGSNLVVDHRMERIGKKRSTDIYNCICHTLLRVFLMGLSSMPRPLSKDLLSNVRQDSVFQGLQLYFPEIKAMLSCTSRLSNQVTYKRV